MVFLIQVEFDDIFCDFSNGESSKFPQSILLSALLFEISLLIRQTKIHIQSQCRMCLLWKKVVQKPTKRNSQQ